MQTRGQEALRSAVEGDRAYQTRSRSEFLPPEEGLKSGPVTYLVGMGYGLEWLDNVFYQSTDAKSDFIHSARATIRATWPVTRESMLSVGVGVGYLKYTDHDELDRFFVTPDSELAWDIPVKDWVFTLYERAHYSQDVVSQGALSGRAEYPRLENTIGARARWMPDRYVLEAGYGHFNFWSDSGQYKYLNRASEQLFARAGYRLAEISHVGVEASASFTTYDTGERGDNRSFSAGPYLNWQITEATDLTLHGGYVNYRFDPDTLNPVSRDLSSWYVRGELRNRLTDRFTHTVSLSREVEQGINRGADYLESLLARYDVGWAFHRQGLLSADAFYEHGTEPWGARDETYDRYGLGARLNWRFTKHLSAGAGYRYVNKDSRSRIRDYQLNAVTVNLDYRF